MQRKTGMVGMGGLGSLVNYKERGLLQSASVREWAHQVVTESLPMTNLLLQLRHIPLFPPAVPAIRLISSKRKEEQKDRLEGFKADYLNH